jgi:transcriptional regulator with XRE-family HTH domain
MEELKSPVHAVFSANIRKYRIAKKITQAYLAELAGVSTNYMNQVELGNKFPSGNMIAILARCLGVRLFELFIEDDVSFDLGQYSFEKEARKIADDITVAVQQVIDSHFKK